MTLLTISCSASDCYNGGGGLNTGTNIAYVAGSPASSDPTRVWLPFIVGLPRKTITSATLRYVASANGNAADIAYKIHASAEDNAANPTTFNQLQDKIGTSAEINPATLPSSVGVEYSYNVTSIVQEILNRGGWAFGNNLGIMLSTTIYDSTKRCEIALTEHVTYAEPKLDIVFPTFFPKSAMVL